MTTAARAAWLLGALLATAGAAGCARCGSGLTGSTVDAGARARRVQRSIDLRSALMLTFPEYRGARVTGSTVTLTRTMRGSKDWATELAHAMARHNFTPDGDGGVGGERPPYRMDLVRDGPTAELALHLHLDSAAVQRVYDAPFAVSTLELGLFLPRGEGLVTEREVFELRLAYVAPEERAAFLSRQLIDLCLGNGQWTARGFPDAGWEEGRRPDGGFGDVPAQFDVTLDGKVDGATIAVHRDGKQVEVRYTLVTDAPAGD